MGTPGPLIGTGRSADVYDLGDGRVLRRYRDAAASTETEALAMQRLAEQDYPVPAVFDASGPDLVMERLEGPTLLKSVGDRPWTLWSAGALLADLHLRLHRIDGTGLTDRQAGEGSAVLHLDLHPDNVMLTPRGPVVIDWANAAVGDGAYDVAYVWMVMVIATIPGRGIDGVLNPIGRRLLRTSFLRHFDRRSAVRPWCASSKRARCRCGTSMPSSMSASDAWSSGCRRPRPAVDRGVTDGLDHRGTMPVPGPLDRS